MPPVAGGLTAGELGDDGLDGDGVTVVGGDGGVAPVVGVGGVAPVVGVGGVGAVGESDAVSVGGATDVDDDWPSTECKWKQLRLRSRII